MLVRRDLPAFKADDVSTPEALARNLSALTGRLSERLGALEQLGRVAILDDILLETGGSLAVGTAPFPLRVQTPFSVAGAWVVLCEATALGESGVATNAVAVWSRPVSGGVDGSAYALEIQFITGLTISRKYRLRLAVVGVKNG